MISVPWVNQTIFKKEETFPRTSKWMSVTIIIPQTGPTEQE